MKLPNIKPYLKKSKVYGNGYSPIYISLIKDRKQSLISTGHSVPHEAWNEKKGNVYEAKPKITSAQKSMLTYGELAVLKNEYSKAIVLYNAKSINQEIKNKIAELTLLQNKIRANDESLDVKNIKKRFDINPDLDHTKNFLIYADGLTNNLLAVGKIGTYKRYKTNLKRLEEYMKPRNLSFQDINVQFLNEYEIYLQKDGLKTNSIHNNLKTIRAVYYTAIKEEIIPQDKNPFFTFKLKIDKYTKKEKLNPDEVVKIENLELEEANLLWHCRNYFIFSFNLAGIRIGDFIQLKWGNITNDGRLDYYMDKTGGFKSVKMNEKAKKILAYYCQDGIKPTDFIFPLLSKEVDYSDPLFLFNQVSAKTALVNKYLKKIAVLAKIEKNLTTHIARHSFSDIARKKKASIYDIKNMLGHSSIKITEAYLTSLDYESQDDAMKNILDF